MPSRFWFLVQIFFFSLFFNHDLASKSELTSLEHYRSGLSFLDSGKTLSAIDAFKTAIVKDREFADAYHQLALAYMKVGTIESRKQATFALNKAVRLDSKNVQYQMDMAKLLLKKGMKGGAKSCLKKVLELDPSNAEAYYQLGLLKEDDMLWYKDMINPKHDGIFLTFTGYANEHLRDARDYFKKATEANSDFAPAYYHLALTQHELSDYDGMAEYLKAASGIQPENKDFYLFLGLAYHRMGNFFLANQKFQSAKNFMSNEELALYESLEAVLQPEVKQKYVGMSASEKISYERKFWKQRDPLFMTDFNERLLEHYSRFAYANLRFSDPDNGIEGWQTDRGKTFIRFGPPKVKYRTWPRIEITLGSGGNPLIASKENWIYNNFDLTFEDEFLSRNFKFKRSFNPDDDSKIVFEQLIKQAPEFYEPDFSSDMFEIPHLITQFMGSEGKTRIVVNFGVPRDEVTPKYANIFMRRGLFIFDNDWNDISKEIKNLRLSLTDQVSNQDAALLLDKVEIQLMPESYQIALELVDQNSGKIGRLRRKLQARQFDPQDLEISDLLLADDIHADSSLTKNSESVKILPNLFNQFEVLKSIFVYFEVYNLELDDGGASHFSIETILSPLEEQKSGFAKLTSNVSRLFGLGKSKQTKVSTLYEYYGNSTIESVHNSLRLADTKPGKYNLVVKVEDVNRGRRTENNVTFEILNHLNKKEGKLNDRK